MPNRRIAIARWLPCAAFACVSSIMLYFFIYVFRHTSRRHFEDFWHFYTAAQALDQGKSPYEVIAPGFDRPGYIYPPLIAFLYWPLARFLSIGNAARISLVVNIAALWGGLWIGARAMLERFAEARVRSTSFSLSEKQAEAWTPYAATALVMLGALLLTFDKAKGELQMLQTNASILAALAVALWQLDRRPWLVGAALGFALNIKYQTLVMLPYLLLRRRWKAAGWMAAWTFFWGMLPGLLVGFGTEARYLEVAFGGILRLVGINAGGGPAAEIESIRAGFSISITSAVARHLASRGSSVSPMLVSGVIGLIWLAILAAIYAARRVPWIRWPAAKFQAAEPFRRWVAIEWMILIGTTLCFSPQTNTRHLLLVAILNLGALSLLLAKARTGDIRSAWLVVAAIIILWAGITLPPGHRQPAPAPQPRAATAAPRMDIQDPAVAWWHNIGGPSWAMLLAMGLMTGAAQSRSAGREEPAVPETNFR